MQTWEPDLRDRMLRMQFEAQRHAYRGEFPHAETRLILRDGLPIGWVIVDRSGRELHGIDIALLPDQQRQGVGTRVIQSLQAEAAAASRAMVITVQRRNFRALSLYRRLGFRAIRDTEAHIVMEWRHARP